MDMSEMEMIMANMFDEIIIALFDVVIQLLPTVLIIVGILIVVKVALNVFTKVILGNPEDRKLQDKMDRNMERDKEKSVQNKEKPDQMSIDDWGNSDVMSGREFWDNHYKHKSYDHPLTMSNDDDYVENRYSWFD